MVEERSQEVEDRWRAAMVAAQRGDAEAYQQLLKELLPFVRGIVRARVFDANAVEDVTQNALLAMHRGRRTYRAEHPIGPWLRAIVRNSIIDHLRERGRRLERELVLDEDWPDPVSRVDAPTQDGLSKPLEQALARLPEGQRAAVLMVQVEGLSVAEAALKAGVSVGALKVRAHRGYRALQRALAEMGIEGPEGAREGGS